MVLAGIGEARVGSAHRGPREVLLWECYWAMAIWALTKKHIVEARQLCGIRYAYVCVTL